MDFDRFTITLLVLRDDAPEFTPEQEDALQDAHMSHLADLHQAGHLLAAGPLLERDSRFRGLSILSVGVEQARALKESDPAVQAGKYAVMALPWMVPAGAMSFSPTHFPRSASEATGSSTGPQSTPPPAPRPASLPVGHEVTARLAADLSRKISLFRGYSCPVGSHATTDVTNLLKSSRIGSERICAPACRTRMDSVSAESRCALSCALCGRR